MDSGLARQAGEAASDRDLGASEILGRVLPLLAQAVTAGPEVTRNVARAICAAQPAMVSLWNACAAAVADMTSPGVFARVQAELVRAPAALTRVAVRTLEDTALGVGTPLFLTLSYSASVRRALSAMASVRAVDVVCAESRPRLEGRRLAADLAGAGVSVTITTDAALPAWIDRATAIVVGADAVGAAHWVNKVGTRSLAAAAASTGIPVLVLATRDKFVPTALDPLLRLDVGSSDEVWADRPSGVAAASPVFERVPLDLATLIVTERGVIAPADAGQLARRLAPMAELLLAVLLSQHPPT